MSIDFNADGLLGHQRKWVFAESELPLKSTLGYCSSCREYWKSGNSLPSFCEQGPRFDLEDNVFGFGVLSGASSLISGQLSSAH